MNLSFKADTEPEPVPKQVATTWQLQAQFEDVQLQAAALTGWNQNYLQLSCGSFRGHLTRIQLGALTIFVENLSNAVYQEGQLDDSVLALGMPLQSEGPSFFCGSPSQSDLIHLFTGSQGFQFRTAPKHTMLGIEMRAQLANLLSEYHSPYRLARGGAGLRCAPPEKVQALRSTLLAILNTSLVSPQLLTVRPIVAQITDHLCHQVDNLNLSRASLPSTNRSIRNAWGWIQRARLIAQHALERDEVVTVAELCLQLNVSRRTLQHAFQQCLGVSPLAWLRTYRLAAVRRALLKGQSVTDAATALGFWHFGHFAHHYHALFGELPSQTLRCRPQF